MPAKVSPYLNMPPPREYPRSGSSPQKQHQHAHATFLDVVLDHVVCCASDDGHPSASSNSNNNNNNFSTRRASSAAESKGRHIFSSGNNNFGRPPLLNQRDNSSQSLNDDNISKLNTSAFSRSTSKSSRSRDSIILPHLRFKALTSSSSSSQQHHQQQQSPASSASTKLNNPISSSSSSSSSSLQDFFDLFLADDAPHPFQLFHETNGDENVRTTPWKTVAMNGLNTSKDDIISMMESDDMMERTITFHTKITPGSSSNPLSQSEHHVNSSNSNSSSSTVIPLEVTITQSLIQQQSKKWILECEFRFDFSNSPNSSSSGGSSNTTKLGSGGLGTGLSQFLMSNVVKGSTVNVTVVLSECDEFDDRRGVASKQLQRSISYNNQYTTNQRIQNRSTGNGSVSSLPAAQRQFCGRPTALQTCEEEEQGGILSCLSHPLLLPPEGLCGSGTGSSNDSRGLRNRGKKKKRGSNKNNSAVAVVAMRQTISNDVLTTFEEPPAAQVGASLLSAIKAKNRNNDDDAEGHMLDASLVATTPVLSNNNGSSRFDGLTIPTYDNTKLSEMSPREDVLTRSCSGSLKVKHMPSFELSRASSNTSMRRIILEKDAAGASSAANEGYYYGGCASSDIASVNDPGAYNSNGGSVSAVSTESSSAVASPQGLSMHIEMEVANQSNNNTAPSTASSISTSFSRSASLSSIDDKIRRGLKKRVARSWISWAESWCMRLWEEEEGMIQATGRGRRVVLGGLDGSYGKRCKKNVRPSVRRIGQPKPVKPATSSSLSSSEWKPLAHAEEINNGSGSRRTERWMSLEKEGEMGVEVACSTMPTPATANHTRSKTRFFSSDKGSKEMDGPKSKVVRTSNSDKPSKKMKRRLLKSLS